MTLLAGEGGLSQEWTSGSNAGDKSGSSRSEAGVKNLREDAFEVMVMILWRGKIIVKFKSFIPQKGHDATASQYSRSSPSLFIPPSWQGLVGAAKRYITVQSAMSILGPM